MGKIAIIVLALVIIILFAIKKSYKELLIILTISLITDWIFVHAFSTTPLIRTIAILLGKPILSVLIYTIIEFICMGIFYYLLQKYSHIISLTVYIIINLLINKFYMTISGSILLDLLFNIIIGIIITIVYRKNIKMGYINYFAIIGMTINAIFTFLISRVFKVVGVTIFIFISVFWPLFMPYIIGAILSAIIICLIRKKLIEKDKKTKILIYAITIIICVHISVKAGYAFLLYESARPDKTYTEMKEINENQSFIGLSKEDVIKLLGNTYKEINNGNGKIIYEYDAGKITNRLFFGESDFYKLRIFFDENEKVETTSINMII